MNLDHKTNDQLRRELADLRQDLAMAETARLLDANTDGNQRRIEDDRQKIALILAVLEGRGARG